MQNNMTEVLRPRVEPTVSAPEPQGEFKPEDKSIFPSKVETAVSREYKDNLEVWETEGKKKYVNEYFDTHKTAGSFIVKMPIGVIDKFVRGELQDRKYEKTTANFRTILEEIEREIGSEKLNLFERLNKLTGYIKAFNRMRDAKKKLGAYKADGMA
jgi:hypothetical protein